MSSQVIEVRNYTPEQIELVKNVICKGSTNDELDLFMYQCKRTGLDPFLRQIWSVEQKSWNKDKKTYESSRTTQVSIDGLRLIAQRTGEYEGQTQTLWCGQDGKWLDVWVKNEPPSAAKVGVFRRGFKEPLYAIARLETYGKKTKEGALTRFWQTMPDLMLAKCAEALALRKAFPMELSGLYTNDEMENNVGESRDEKSKPLPNEKAKKENKSTPPLEEIPVKLIEKIEGAQSIDELKSAYKNVYNIAMGNRDSKLMEIATEAKDKRKKEIEDKKMIDEFYGEEKNETV